MKKIIANALRLIVLLTVYMLINAGCAHTLRDPGANHIVIVNPTGQLIDGKEKPTNEVWVANIFTNMTSSACLSHTNILIFFQGGLNNYNDGIDRANDLSCQITNNNPYYPIFFTWNSDLFSSWKDHFLCVLPNGEDVHCKWYNFWTVPLFNTPIDVCRLIGRVPFTVFQTSRNIPSATIFAPIGNIGTNVVPPAQLQIIETKASAPLLTAYTNLAGSGMNILLGTNKTSLIMPEALESGVLGYPHMAGSLIVDTGGKEGWDQMLRRTETMFVVPDTYKDGGAEIFVQHLIKFLSTNTNYDVTLIAHSAGSIIANEIIRRHGAQLRIKNIVYMAAACGIQDFTKCVVPFMVSNTNVHFYNLCLHPYNERTERHMNVDWNPWVNWIVNIPEEIITPQGSLLQWIDDYYSNADTKFGWTLGKLENVLPGMQAAMIPTNIYPRITIKCFGVGSLHDCGPQEHGNFTQVRFWDTNFWQGPWTADMLIQSNRPVQTDMSSQTNIVAQMRK